MGFWKIRSSENLPRLSVHYPEPPSDQDQGDQGKHNQDQGIDQYITEQEIFNKGNIDQVRHRNRGE